MTKIITNGISHKFEFTTQSCSNMCHVLMYCDESDFKMTLNMLISIAVYCIIVVALCFYKTIAAIGSLI